MTFILSMSPTVRVRLTVKREMERDPEQKFYNDDLYRRYLEMHRLSTTRLDGLLKYMAIVDGLLAFVISGKSITVPVVGVALKDVPAAVEVLTAMASFMFMLLSLNFLTSQLYQAIIEEFNIRRVAGSPIDPEFLTAADVYTELSLKSFRPEMNLHGPNFFTAGTGFKAYFMLFAILLLLAFSMLLFLHLGLVGSGIWLSYSGTWLSWLFCAAVVVVNLVGILSNLMIGFNFAVLDVDDSGVGGK
jgi:hypothetical protein